MDCNTVIASCPIIDPITFELEIKRNMSGSKTEHDPAELKVTGVLKEISASMSRGDYNVLMAILVENFQEKGDFELSKNEPKRSPRPQILDRNSLTLNVKSRYTSGSRTSLTGSGSVKSLRAALSVDQERHPLSKVVEFNFKFRGFQAEIYSGKTELEIGNNVRDVNLSMAKIHIQLLSVDGFYYFDGSLIANAFLQNLVLEDSRMHEETHENRYFLRELKIGKIRFFYGKSKSF